MMRFNKKGGFNVPFCRKPTRFAPALVTKICNQITAVSQIIEHGDFEFRHQEFDTTLSEVGQADLVYCDPPYIGRHVDYFDSWSEEEEARLHAFLIDSNCHFIMSTWLKNRYRVNGYVSSLWRECSVLTKAHYYHVGAKENNRNAVIEALMVNFPAEGSVPIRDLDTSAIADPDERQTIPTTPQTPLAI